METKDGDSDLIKKMKVDAQQNLNKRYTKTEDILLSSFLHPRTKGLPFVDSERRENIKKSQREEMWADSIAKRARAAVETVNLNLLNSAASVKAEPTDSEVKVELSDVVQSKRIKLEVDVMDWLDDVVVANDEPIVQASTEHF